MSFAPILFCDFMERPLGNPHLLEKHFGNGIFPAQDLVLAFNHIPQKRGCTRPCPHGAKNQVAEQQSQDGFQVSVDVQQFTPEEISVRMVDSFIIVEGKHEESQDEHGFVSRHFVRKYKFPEGFDSSQVVSSLSSDGVLTVKAPKLALPESELERTIPVVQTGKAAKDTRRSDDADKENPVKSPSTKS